jgi:Zn-dependent protease
MFGISRTADRATDRTGIRCYLCGGRIHVEDQRCPGCGRQVSQPEKEALGGPSLSPAQAPESGSPMEPAAPAGPASCDADFEEAWQEIRRKGPGGRGSLVPAVVTLLIFTTVNSGRFGWHTALCFAVAIVLHELGHWVAMRIFGYRDLRVFFIPFLGAIASGRAVGTSGWRRGLVLLAGPLPGLMLAWGIAMVLGSQLLQDEWWLGLVGMLFTLNAFNLLPLVPLDGGQLVRQVLFARHPIFETAFAVLTGIGLAALGLARHAWALVLFSAFVVFLSLTGHKLAVAARRVRPHLAGAGNDLLQLGDSQRRALFDATRSALARVLELTRNEGQEQRRKILAANMVAVFERAMTAPTGGVASVALFLLHVFGLWLAWPVLQTSR